MRKLKGLIFWSGAVVVGTTFSMYHKEVSLRDLVRAEKLDIKALTEPGIKFYWINQPDHDGRTPLHYIMLHKDSTIEVVDFFIKQGAELEIQNNFKETPYDEGFAYKGCSPIEGEQNYYYCDKKVLRYLFHETLVKRLKEIKRRQKHNI